MEFATALITFIAQGGFPAIIGLLGAAVAFLLWDRKITTKLLTDTTQRVYDAKDSETKTIKEIVDRYHQGNLDLVQALNEIKIVLVTIQSAKR